MNVKHLAVVMLALGLFACNSTGSYYDVQYEPYQYEDTRYYAPQSDMYMEYDSTSDAQENKAYPQQSTTPARIPVSAKQQDEQWITRQSPDAYTIELAVDSNPAAVAKKLSQAPKANRTAEVRAQGAYKGVYGSYATYQEAVQALNALPADVRGGAKIQQWRAIQGY